MDPDRYSAVREQMRIPFPGAKSANHRNYIEPIRRQLRDPCPEPACLIYVSIRVYMYSTADPDVRHSIYLPDESHIHTHHERVRVCEYEGLCLDMIIRLRPFTPIQRCSYKQKLAVREVADAFFPRKVFLFIFRLYPL